MKKALLISLLLIAIAAFSWLLFSSPRWPRVALPFYYNELLAEEKELLSQPVEYKTYKASASFRPGGFYSNSNLLFVFSQEQPGQIGLAYSAQKGFQFKQQRNGPLKTIRCLPLPRKDITTACLGELEPAGFRFYGPSSKKVRSPLPGYAGYYDFTASDTHLFVIDSLKEEIVAIQVSNLKITQRITAPAATRLLLTRSYLVYASHANPRLNLVALANDGSLNVRESYHHNLVAPVKTLAFDQRRGVLYTLGPVNKPVKRENGGIKNLASFAYGYPLHKLTGAILKPEVEIDLASLGLADASSITIESDKLLICAQGSHQCFYWQGGEPKQVFNTGLGPRESIQHSGNTLVANYFDNTVTVHNAGKTVQVIRLSEQPDFTIPFNAGEIIFNTAVLGSDRYENRYSCNSCHFGGMLDGRLHYGPSGGRGLTRPARGAGMLGPWFPNMYYDTLSNTVEEFFKAIDYTFWQFPGLPDCWWLSRKELFRGRKEELHLTGKEARRALLHYLARAPVEPPKIRQVGMPLSKKAQQGFEIFWRDCSECHKPMGNTRQAKTLARVEALRYLKDKPLAFGAAQFVKTGIKPWFTSAGIRVNPLTNLNRKSRFFSNGSAANLREVLKMTNVAEELVHSADFKSHEYYNDEETGLLLEFLNSI